jgi:uncharacterized protein YjiS (DUF1127 family)
MLLSLKSPLRLGDPILPFRLALHRLEEMRVAIAGRRAIARMDARMLSDIGLSPSEAMEEINRKPWDITTRPR